MRGPWTLTAKLYTSGATFLVLALASIGLTLWVTWSLEGGAAAVNEAGRIRMQTYRLALELSGKPDSPEALALARSFDESLALLRSGDPSRPLFVPWSHATRDQFERVNARWQLLRDSWLGSHPTPAQASRDAGEFVVEVDAFVAEIEAQIARWTAILHMFQLAMMALAIGSAVVMLYAGYLFVLNPLARLQRGLTDVQQGDLSTRVEVGQRRRVRAAVGGLQRHGAYASVALRQPGGKGAREDGAPRGQAPAPGGPVRGECLPGARHHARGPRARLRAAGAAGGQGRRRGGALVRRRQQALPDAGR